MNRPNLIVITADDLGYGYLGSENGPIPNLTPCLDHYASTAFQFHQAHTVCSWCHPSRASLITGLYPWHHGVLLLFIDMKNGTQTLPMILRKHNYFTAIHGKEMHHRPSSMFGWNLQRTQRRLTPNQFIRDFLDAYKASKLPNFFLLLNSTFPHRPWPMESIYKPDDVFVPPYLNDTPKCRWELSRYYMAIRSLDQMVEESLHLLKNYLDNSILVFTSDHGAAVPFVKVSCYPFSTHIPFFVRFPGSTSGTTSDVLVNHTEFVPTILDVLGIASQIEFDGASYAKLFEGGTISRDYIMSCLFKLNAAEGSFETRGIHNKELSYIRNFWSDGKQFFREDGSLGGQEAFETLNPERKRFFRYRCPEEFYELDCDPYCLRNRINDPVLKEKKDFMASELNRLMLSLGDPLILNKVI